MNSARSLVSFLRRQGRKISPLLILTHDHPDPDALASAWALAHLARFLAGVRSRIVYGGIIGRVENQTMARLLDVPVHPLRERTDFRRFRAVALVDTQPLFGNNPFPKDGQATLVVDHHAPLRQIASVAAIIDPSAGATGVILAQALLLARCPVPPDLATALVYGILSETQDLGRETRDLEIRTYREMLSRCDLRTLALIQNPQRPAEFFLTLKRSLEHAFVAGPLIGAHLGSVRAPDLVSQTADFLLTVEGMRWSLCTGWVEGRLYSSLRALHPERHAGRLLQAVLGEKDRAGGHSTMAGGSIAFPSRTTGAALRKQEERVAARLLKLLFKGRAAPRIYPFRS